jgi:hypothetical protein
MKPQISSFHRSIFAGNSRDLFHPGRQRSVHVEFGGHPFARYTRVRSYIYKRLDNFHFIHSFPRGVDGNVPTWHSRELVSVLKTWAADAPVKYARTPSPLLLRRLNVSLAITRSKGMVIGTRPFSRILT